MNEQLIEKLEKIKFNYKSTGFLEIYNTLNEAIAALTSVKSEPNYPIGGYAPGNYMCHCSTCKSYFKGDKRASQCEPCATKGVKSESAEDKAKKLLNNIKPPLSESEQKWFTRGFCTAMHDFANNSEEKK